MGAIFTLNLRSGGVSINKTYTVKYVPLATKDTEPILEYINIKDGMEQLRRIGTENFQYDGKAPKSIMTQDGKVYKPVSKLFLLYNYAKVLKQKGMQGELEAFQKEYPYAFTIYGDEEHREHDLFYKEQMGQYKDVIFYPVYQRVYKIGRGPQDFFVYYDAAKSVPVSQVPE